MVITLSRRHKGIRRLRRRSRTHNRIVARFARWNRRPEDPTTPAGWLLWHEFHLSPGHRRKTGYVALGSALAFAISLAFGFAMALFVALLGIVAVAVYARPGAREHAALPTLGEHAAFPITLDLTGPKGKRLGRERGWIAFVDGWLVYEGLRTAFSVDAASVERARSRGWEIRLDLPGGGRARLILLTDSLQTDRPSGWSDRKGLSESFKDWLAHPSVQGEPVMPPSVPHPSVVAECLIPPLAGFALSVVVALAGLLNGTVPVLAVGIALMTGTMVGYRWQFRRVERRLALDR